MKKKKKTHFTLIQARPVRTRNRTLHNKNLTTRYRTLSNKIY